MSNLISNIFKVLNDEIDKKKYKNKDEIFSQETRDCCKNEKITFFSQTKELFKKERYLNLHNFNNTNAITKIRLLSRNFPINTTKWYNLQENMKFSKNCEKKQMQNGINIIFSCNKYDNNRMKAFNNINEVDNIKL